MHRVIFFDLDETLVAQEDAFDQAYQSTALWLSSKLPDVAAAELAQGIPLAAEAALRESPLATTIRRCRFGGRDLLWGNPGFGDGATPIIEVHIDKFRISVWRTLLKNYRVNIPSVELELNRRFRSSMFLSLSVFSDARRALKRLSSRYRLAIITNGLGAGQREKLAYLGLDRYFEAVIASAEVGDGKPAPRIFESALQVMGVGPGDALMVGDSFEGDIGGAETVGIKAVWLNRAACDHSSAGAQISSLADWSPAEFLGTRSIQSESQSP